MNKHNTNQRDEMLMHLSVLDFMMLDLGLYLNTNPTDANALALHDTVARDASALRQAYETQFGPLTSRSASASNRQWDWISDPWPWEPLANFDIA